MSWPWDRSQDTGANLPVCVSHGLDPTVTVRAQWLGSPLPPESPAPSLPKPPGKGSKTRSSQRSHVDQRRPGETAQLKMLRVAFYGEEKEIGN